MVEWNIYSADEEVKEIVGRNVLIKANALFDRAPKKFAKKDDPTQPDAIKLFQFLFQKKIISKSQINKLARRHRELEEQEDALTMHNQQIPVTNPPVSETMPYVPKTKAESPETIEVNGLGGKVQEEDSSGAIDIFGIVDEEAPLTKKPAKKAPAKASKKTAKKETAYPFFQEKWYKFQRKLGKGAMGEVDLCLYTKLDPAIPVAVKNILKNLATDMYKKRFLNEQKAATLCINNPRVARILDVGCDSKGNLRMATEFVEGRPLTDLLNDVKEGKPSARTMYPRAVLLRLVQEILYGLDGVHEQGVVHRDVKPDNIMITDKNEVKITDFGIAKIKNKKDILNAMKNKLGLEDDLTSEGFSETSAMETKAGTTVGTPRYIPPEQIDDCSSVDGRADQYSVGVMLYEILTEEPPHAGRTLQETLKKILFDMPESPSTVIKKKQEAARKQAGKKKQKMRPLENIPADLDAIIIKALEKKPAKRYRTAKDMADDIERFLNYEPVKARKIGLIEKATRWMAQHRLATSLIGLLLVGGIGAGFAVQHQSAQTRIEQKEKERAKADARAAKKEKQRAKADARAAKAEAKAEKKDREIAEKNARLEALARKLAEKERDAAQREVKGQSLSEAILLGLKRIRPDKDYYNAALNLINEAITKSEDFWMPYLKRAKLKATFGKHEEAEEDFETANEMFKKQFDKYSIEIWFEAGMHYGLPFELGGRGEEDLALEYFEKAFKADPDSKHGKLAKAVALLIKAKNNPKNAEEQLEKAIELAEKLTEDVYMRNIDETWLIKAWANGTSVFAEYQNNPLFLKHADLPEAEDALLKVVTPTNGEISLRNFLAAIFLQQGKHKEAIAVYSNILKVIERDYIYNNLAIARIQEGNLEGALTDINKSIQLNNEYPLAYVTRAEIFMRQGGHNNLEKAIQDCNRAIDLDSELEDAHIHLGRAYHVQGNIQKAIENFNYVLKKLNPKNAEAHYRLGNTYAHQGQLDKAKSHLDIAIKYNDRHLLAHCDRAIIHGLHGEWNKAIIHCKKAVAIDPRSGQAQNGLGDCYINLKQYDKAEKPIQNAMAVGYELAYVTWGELLMKKGEYNRAERAFQDAYKKAPKFKQLIDKNMEELRKLKRNN